MFKRPLCYAVLAFFAAVCLFLFLFPYNSYNTGHEPHETVSLWGRVTAREYKKDKDGKRTVVIYIDDGTGTETLVQVYLSDASYIPCIGENIKLRGKIREFSPASNPGEFDSAFYYKILKIEYQIKDAVILQRDGNYDLLSENLAEAKEYLSGVLDESLNEQDAAIMKAMLLGDRAAIDAEIKELYQNAGIIHILSISGLHISILGMGLYKLLRRLALRIPAAAGVCVSVMILYGMMCGMGSSAVRAIIMFGLRLLSSVIGRTYDMMTAMAVAALLLLCDQPLFIYHSGFLMSFGAVAGIGIVMPVLPKMYCRSMVLSYAADIIRSSLGVSLVILPVQMQTYYTNLLDSYPKKYPGTTTDVPLLTYYNLVRNYSYEWVAYGVEGMNL
jgi:competence protein ComEC